MKKYFILSLFTILSFLSVPSNSQIIVGTGSPTGTYSRMFKELRVNCDPNLQVTEKNTSGSVENIDLIITNQINAAFTQTDVLYYKAKQENLDNIKTLFTLHNEEVHVITLTNSKNKEGGFLGIGGKSISLNTFKDLSGKTIASFGGSFITANVINYQSGLKFNIREVVDFKEAKSLLDKGEVDAILLVGGSPMVDISSLNKEYKLLPFSDDIINKLKTVYSSGKINYPNLNSSINTLTIQTIFVSRVYKLVKNNDNLKILKKCLNDNLDSLQETTGMHKKWLEVKTNDIGKWPMLDFSNKK